MEMNETVDARGLSCPQPVLLTLNKIKSVKRGNLVIRVDTDTSRENVIRAARSQGWEVKEVHPEGIGYRIAIAGK
jgi:tRNA 2-thiouridine synthesizing protein A